MEVDRLERICGYVDSLDTERIVSVEATDFLRAAGNSLVDSLIQLRSLLKISHDAHQKDNIEKETCVPFIAPDDIAEADGCIETCVIKLLSVCNAETSSPSLVFMVLELLLFIIALLRHVGFFHYPSYSDNCDHTLGGNFQNNRGNPGIP